MSVQQSLATGLSSDLKTLDALRASAGRDPRAAIKEAARQFEAVFMQELMKSMRATTLPSGLGDNSGTDMGTELLDNQYATQLSGLPGGLADMIAKQLERNLAGGNAAAEAAPKPTPAPAERAAARAAATQEDFLRQHQAAASLAAQQTGLPESFILAQAAHESAWGRREIRAADGSPSHNLFGIKAAGKWSGKVAEVTTTEYVNGEARKQVARFRAYGSYEEAFLDYARLLRDNERYAQVMRQGSTPQAFAQGLQKAGYATDPAYADKLTRVINTTLRLQRATIT